MSPRMLLLGPQHKRMPAVQDVGPKPNLHDADVPHQFAPYGLQLRLPPLVDFVIELHEALPCELIQRDPVALQQVDQLLLLVIGDPCPGPVLLQALGARGEVAARRQADFGQLGPGSVLDGHLDGMRLVFGKNTRDGVGGATCLLVAIGILWHVEARLLHCRAELELRDEAALHRVLPLPVLVRAQHHRQRLVPLTELAPRGDLGLDPQLTRLALVIPKVEIDSDQLD
mmetsp:Transcript_52744/g.126202  ORF Transcript_52744/g.126202 Transcript_52744/m.126202 type:complete len:228 (-) Transcript_52744:872-1555(-)